MSTLTISTVPIHVCRWDWCRETFETGDRLARHVLDDHIAKEVPVKREDIRLELRAFDGTSIGEDSIRTSMLMNENVTLDEEEKESGSPAHDDDRSPSNSIHQNAVADCAEQETRIDYGTPPFIADAVAPEPDMFTSDHGRQSPSRTALRSHGASSFRELTASSSPSPDVDAMAIAPSPSLAELVAETINNSNRVGTSGRITPACGSDKPLSSAGAGQYSRSQSTQGKRKFADPAPGEASGSRKRSGSQPSCHSLSVTRSRSRTSSNASHKEVRHTSSEATAPALSAIREAVEIPTLQAGLQSDTQDSGVATSALRPFRTGSIQLVPDPPPLRLRTDDPSSARAETPPPSETLSRLQNAQEHAEPGRPASSYIDDIVTLSSSFDPSIPALTQPFDVQNQSQWPLATQAPYSCDSSLTLNSQ